MSGQNARHRRSGYSAVDVSPFTALDHLTPISSLRGLLASELTSASRIQSQRFLLPMFEGRRIDSRATSL